MSRTVKRHRFWLIPVCIVVAGIMSLYGWQQLNAQTPGGEIRGESGLPTGAPGSVPPGAPGVPGDPNAPAPAPMAPPAPSAPTIELASVLPTGVKAMNIKNWDGQVTSILRFKYKILDDRVITVHLPALYKKEKMTRDAWDTLFQCFGMDVEARMEAGNRNQLVDMGPFASRFMAELKGEVPGIMSSAPQEKIDPVTGAPIDLTRTDLPDVYGGDVSLPPLMPGMP